MKKLFFTLSFILAISASSSVMCQEQEVINYLTEFLNRFCIENYKECYLDRTYIEQSLKVTSYNEYKENGITCTKIMGKHSYKGRYGSRYDNMDFIAYLKFLPNKEYSIEFHKRAKADFYHSEDYWEKCSPKTYFAK